jgi:hypothetical protein
MMLSMTFCLAIILIVLNFSYDFILFFMFFLLIIFSQVYLVNLYHSYDFILFIYAIFKTKIDICYLKKKTKQNS